MASTYEEKLDAMNTNLRELMDQHDSGQRSMIATLQRILHMSSLPVQATYDSLCLELANARFITNEELQYKELQRLVHRYTFFAQIADLYPPSPFERVIEN